MNLSTGFILPKGSKSVILALICPLAGVRAPFCAEKVSVLLVGVGEVAALDVGYV